jgi:hypothetical protein
MVTALSLATGARIYSSDGKDTTNAALATAKGSALLAGDQFLIASSSTVTYAEPVKEVEISQFQLDFGITANPFIDQATATGHAYYAGQDREPKITMNPYHTRKTQDDIDFAVTQSCQGRVTIASALSSPHVTIEVARAQLMPPEIASREGYINTNRTYRALRNNQGGVSTEALLPDYAMYTVLIGTRS